MKGDISITAVFDSGYYNCNIMLINNYDVLNKGLNDLWGISEVIGNISLPNFRFLFPQITPADINFIIAMDYTVQDISN